MGLIDFRSALAYLLLTSAIYTEAKAQNVSQNTSGPIVDLGYALHRPTSVNLTGNYYNFSNIRYAAPPVGNLRWRAPELPLRDRDTVNDGSLGYICPQAPPSWFTQANTALGNLSAVIPPAVTGQTENEDCLFLDIITPIDLFQRSRDPRNHQTNAPVLVNIHGGGFFIGDKLTLYPPNGLLDGAENKMIYVSMNYRLGAFGFLSGLQPNSSNQTTPNAGLLDQRFVLQWVQKYIGLFGGDANQVTITGQSAGGGSVLYHTTAYGGTNETNLFTGGIAQSPAPIASDPIYASLGANLFLRSAGVTDIDAARKLPSSVLQAANKAAQNTTPFDVVYFGPVVDKSLIQDIIPRSYSKGLYNKKITMIAGNTQNEARFLGNQSIKASADFDNWVNKTFPSASTSVKNQIINNVYPPTYDGSLPYRNPQERSDLAVKEYLISCNTASIARAYQNNTYNYIFGIPPAIHSQDLAYTYTPNAPTPGFYPEIATDIQGYLAQFALTGNPNRDDLPAWQNYGFNTRALNFTTTGIQKITSDASNSRCGFWNSGSYFPTV